MRPILFSILMIALSSLEIVAVAPPASDRSVKPRAVLDGIDYSYTNCAAAFTKDSKTLATGGPPYSLKLWDVARGKLIVDINRFGTNPEVLGLEALAFSPEGETLAVAAEDTAVIQMWSVEKRKVRASFKSPPIRINSILFSPNGKTLVTASSDQAVRLYDPATGKLLLTMKGHEEWAGPLAFSADGKMLACGGGGGDIHLWNIPKGTPKRRLLGRKYGTALNESKAAIDSVALSADGSMLMSADSARVVKLWDIATGKEVLMFEAAALAVLTADGKYVIANGSFEVLVHRTSDGKRVATHKHRYTHADAFVLSPDGKTIASVLNDSRVLLWDVPSLLRKVK